MATIETPNKAAREEFARSSYCWLTPESQILAKQLAKKRKKSLAWAVERLLIPDDKPLKGWRFEIGYADEKAREGQQVLIFLTHFSTRAVAFHGLTSEETDMAIVVAKTLLEFLGVQKKDFILAPGVDEAIKKHSTPAEMEALCADGDQSPASPQEIAA